jgi:glyoxylase-like metal-dependent hydrolase (beta-lactamase superfamily II)
MSSLVRFFSRAVGLVALALILAVFFLARDGFARWQTSAYPLPGASFRTWDEVFAHPAPVTVETIVTGFIDMNRCDNLDQANPGIAACRSPEPLLDLVHVIQHQREGVYLVDSGFAKVFATSPPYGNYSLAMQLFNRALGVRNGQRAHQSAAEVLRDRRLEPRAVFFTHLHPDHTSGAAELAADIDYVFGKQEADFAARVSVGSHFANKPRLKTLDFTGVAPMPPLGPAVDLLGDGSLWAISTPGHTPDHTSYLVNSTPPTLLVGDASHFAWAFDHDIAARALTAADRVRSIESLAALRRFAVTYPQVRIVFGHELEAPRHDSAREGGGVLRSGPPSPRERLRRVGGPTVATPHAPS